MRIPGCDGVEFDVRLARDGVPVLLHDETLARVQHRPGRVDRLDRRGARQRPGSRGWTTVLAALHGAWLDVELKGDDHGDATAAVLRAARGEAPDDAVISSFDPPAARRDARPAAGLGPLAQRDRPRARPRCRSRSASAVAAVAVLWGAITPASIRRGARRRAGGRGVDGAPDARPWTGSARLGVVACCVEAAALGPRPADGQGRLGARARLDGRGERRAGPQDELGRQRDRPRGRPFVAGEGLEQLRDRRAGPSPGAAGGSSSGTG